MIPVATTTIRVERRDNVEQATQDPWEEGYADAEADSPFEPVHEGVRAVIKVGAGRQTGPGRAEVIEFTLLSDPIDLHYLDKVVDEWTGQEYDVRWSITSPGVLGMLSSTKAGMTTRKGA